MTNGFAIGILLAIGGFFLLDAYVLRLEAGLFLARKGIDLIQWLTFWR